MTTLDIRRIDPFDDESVDAWWQAYADAERAERGAHAAVWTLEESRHELRQQSETIERRAHLVRRDGVVVASARLALPRRENTARAALGVHVPPAFRRQGIGSAVLTALEAEARVEGRTVLDGEVSWPYALGEDGAGSPGRSFATRHGYALALSDVQSTLSLPVDARILDHLDAEASARSAGFRVESWNGPVPEDVVAGWATLDASLETEAPTGDRVLEASTAAVEDVRASERLLQAQRRTSFGSVAVDADGQVVAYTQIVVSGDDGNAYQWGTLVDRSRRGHRLGTLVKIANLRRLQRESPATSQVITYNAGVNEHMLEINRRLGFVPTERMGEFQKAL
ncbi:GNAT family N-acetyltransferase [Microbacterium gorillae]|uniref:GNAT family N-acetyltransferase n=1 Tax=Microbacterium gorillae TaxID=1231063 RepID=UPI00058EB4AC|nr:GNAT family N-acetyltransferase [Microbacterium gorillae]